MIPTISPPPLVGRNPLVLACSDGTILASTGSVVKIYCDTSVLVCGNVYKCYITLRSCNTRNLFFVFFVLVMVSNLHQMFH